ncbi:MAG: PPC domain-containing protein [Gammaproteobacteria bacterium]|nr:PPC domain-containing protein [Gammaproteobacteria bacterium]
MKQIFVVVFLLCGCLFYNPSHAESPPELVDGVPITLDGARDDYQLFPYYPSDYVSEFDVAIYGGSGDADLYVKAGSPPTKSDYDCRPYRNGNSESCFINRTSDVYYVAVIGYRDFANVTLILDELQCGDCPPPGSVLYNGVPKPNLIGDSGEKLYFSTIIPGNATNINFSISGGSGDADLYVKSGDWQNWPTEADYDCRPYLNGNNENCYFDNSTGKEYFVMVKGYRTFSGVTLVVNYDE